MKLRLLKLWESLRTSFWFVPTLMALAAVLLAVGLIQLDRVMGDRLVQRLGLLYTGGPEGARAVLAVVAGSVMSTAGVTFSITIAALSLASSQFGPRLVTNFMRDTGNQIVLGTFIATFLYCLLILRTVRGGEEALRFVPAISVTAGVALGLASLGVLIYFIHHAAVSIQATHVVTSVVHDLHQSVERLFPQQIGHEPLPRSSRDVHYELPEPFRAGAAVLVAKHNGYLQSVDQETLLATAAEQDLLVRLNFRPGAFVVRGAELAWVRPAARVTAAVRKQMEDSFLIGAQRTHTQDVEYSMDQLVEVAVRALSPGINDPFTAIHCIDQLGAALCHMAQRQIPSGFRLDDKGVLRVVTPSAVTFPGLLDTAFNQIRQYGRDTTAVLMRLLETLATLAHYVRADEDCAALLKHADMVRRAAEALPEPQDCKDVANRYQRVVNAMERGC